MKKLLYLVAGARPNFMKIAPIIRALQKQPENFEFKLIHTGQHYDHEMSDVFFAELGIPQPDYRLECGGGSHAEQTAKIMVAFEIVCKQMKPDCVLVVGDVNSTLACSIAAKKLHIPVAHVEAGLRSGDRSMPEEINRLVTDSISDWFFCTEPVGVDNLIREGKPKNSIFHVGHVMVDNLLFQRERLASEAEFTFHSTSLKKQYPRYGVITLHRPSSVDDQQAFESIIDAFNKISKSLPLIFPVHPRTRASLNRFGITMAEQVVMTGPLSYMDFLNLWKDAVVVLTDSGGLQEETTALGVPCLTLRDNTERPITLDQGTNILVGRDELRIVREAEAIIAGRAKVGRCPQMWDGHSAERIVKHLRDVL